MESKEARQPHFVLIPLMAPGHMIPMVDMAHLLADRPGVVVTIVTTPVNATRISSITDAIARSSLRIQFLTLPFPAVEFGLPDGCENLDILPSRELGPNFLDAARTLCVPLEHHLRTTAPPPSCIISDSGHPWTIGIARELHIPRLIFHGFGCMALLCVRMVREYKLLEKTGDTDDDDKTFVIPGFPDQVQMTRAQLPGYKSIVSESKYREEMNLADAASDGVVVNSFDDLEPCYREYYEKAIRKRVWTIGPMLLSSRNDVNKAVRGNKSTIDEDFCRKWLDTMEPGSVIYVSFGSMAQTSLVQLVEIGLGLEASNCPFIWVIKAGDQAEEVDKWLAGGDGDDRGFEERIRAKGLVIRGWAPQSMILEHPAVGGFMTHCGWNSTIEAVVAGVPMATWPHFAEQFVNEKLVVEILRIGVVVGAKSIVGWREVQEKVTVGRAEVEKAVRCLMDGKEGQANALRQRVKVMRDKARRAMQPGGSSYYNLTDLLEI